MFLVVLSESFKRNVTKGEANSFTGTALLDARELEILWQRNSGAREPFWKGAPFGTVGVSLPSGGQER
jgi:hypothetical protein